MRLSQFLLDAGERPFRELVRRHLERQSATQMRQAVMDESSALPKELQPMVESYIDELNEQLLPRCEFWQKSTCRDAVNAVLDLCNEHLGLSFELPVDAAKMSGVDQELAVELFQIATLNFAYIAVDQPSARKFMGIPTRFPWAQHHYPPLPVGSRGVAVPTGRSGCFPGPRTMGAGIRFGEPRLSSGGFRPRVR